MSKIKKRKLFLISFILIVILFFFSKTILNQLKDKKQIKCVNDPLAEQFSGTEKFLKNNPKDANYLLNVDSFFIDLTTFLFIYYWIVEGQRSVFLSIFLFYIFRSICFLLTEFPHPQNYIFFFTYPSIFIPVKPTNDFFFSGHIGLLTIFFLEASESKFVFFYKLWIEFIWLFTLICLFITQAHYTYDLIFGVFAGYIAFKISSIIYRDFTILSLKVYIRMCIVIDKLFFGNSNKHEVIKNQEEDVKFLTNLNNSF